jgi:hypothetical protein
MNGIASLCLRTVMILRLWTCAPRSASCSSPSGVDVLGQAGAGKDAAQLFEPASCQDLSRLRGCDPEHGSKAGAEVTVVAESRLGRYGRDVVLAGGEPPEPDAETQPQDITRDRLPDGRAELARQVERRTAQRPTETADIPAVCRRAREEGPGTLDSQPLSRSKRMIIVASTGEGSGQRPQQQERRLLRFELIGAGLSKCPTENQKSEMIARAEIADASLNPTDRILDQLGGKCEHHALVTVARRMSDSVLIAWSEHQHGVGVDDGLSPRRSMRNMPRRGRPICVNVLSMSVP